MSAATPLLVPPEHLTRIHGLNSTLYGARNIVGPALGALAVATLPMYGVMGVDVATALMAVLPLLLVQIPEPERSDAGDKVTPAALLRDVVLAIKYIWSWQGLFWLLAIATLLNLLQIPTHTLTPLMIREHFQRGAVEYGTAETAMGIGMVAGGLLLSTWGGFGRRIVTMLVGIGLTGIAITVMGWLPPGGFVAFVVCIFAVGLSGAFTNAPFFALLQQRIPPEMLGRVMTLVMSMAGAAAPLGLALAGPVGDAFGVQVWYLAAGLVTTAMALVACAVPAILRLEEGPATGSAPAPQTD